MSLKAKSEWQEYRVDNSSNVLSARYNEEEQKLQIKFASGMYEYSNIGPNVWGAFKFSTSKGKFVNECLVGPDRKNPIYKGVKVKG